MEADNDNDPLTFISLAALTAGVTRNLSPEEEVKDVTNETEAGSKGTNEQREKERRAYVEQRLRDVAAFERRYRKN